MADSKVRVEVETTANVAGIKQVSAELQTLEEKTKNLTVAQKEMVATHGFWIDARGNIHKVVEEVEQVAATTGKATTQAKSLGDAFGKVSMTKAVGEATTLARELATSSFNARTLGAFLGALGSIATVGAVAGFAIIGVVNNIGEAIIEAAKKMRDLNAEFAKGQERILNMVRGARDLTDLVKLADAVKTDLDKATVFVDQFRAYHLSATKKAADEAIKFLPNLFGSGLSEILKGFGVENKGFFEPRRAEEEAHAIERMHDQVRTLNVEITEGIANIVKWGELQDKVWVGEGEQALKDLGKEVDILREKEAEANRQRELHPEDPGFVIAWKKAVEKVEEANNKLKELQHQQDEYTQGVEASVRVWEKMPAQIQATINAIDKALEHQMDADAKIWQRGLDITQQMKDRAGLARNAGDIERENADKVSKTYDDTLRTARELTLTNGQRVYTDEEAKNKALEASDAVRVGLANKLNNEREEILRKLEAENRVNRATGNDEEEILQKVAKLREEIQVRMEAKSFSPDVIVAEQDKAEAALRQRLETIAGAGKAQSTLNVEMKEYEQILQNIRQQQTVAKDQAFIGVDAQDLQMLRLYRQEIVTVINAMQQQHARKATLTDPAEIARANQELQKFSAQYQVLAAKIVTTTHQFQAQLQSWANSFGSTGTQLANTLQQTVGAALQSFNQWVVTGKFNLQALLQQVVQLGLQLVEQLLIQRAVGLINASLAETQAVASAQIIAAAWAGAATAVTTATEGQAAYGAPAALAIGLAGVKGVLGIGSLHEGGSVAGRRMHSGGLAHDEVPIIAQEGEIMIRRSVAQREGMADFLLGLNDSHDGGFVAGSRYHRGSTTAYGGRGDPGDVGSSLDLMDRFAAFNPREALWSSRIFGGFGTSPSTGLPISGPTLSPTNWVNYPGLGLVPMAQPVGPDTSTQGRGRTLNLRKTSHEGGVISRFHSGGSVGGGGATGGGVHIYAFTDLKALTRHMASKDGQKIIFDTVKGRRIDLGIS